MLRGRRFPAWLVRRRYFKRIENWAKPRRPARREPAAPAEADTGSNVLPFPGALAPASRGVGADIRRTRSA